MINRKVTPATMKLDTGVEVKVYGHIMLKNMWEVYITVLPDIGDAHCKVAPCNMGSS